MARLQSGTGKYSKVDSIITRQKDLSERMKYYNEKLAKKEAELKLLEEQQTSLAKL